MYHTSHTYPDRMGKECAQVQAYDDDFAWVCSLDEDFLSTGCVKMRKNRVSKCCQEFLNSGQVAQHHKKKTSVPLHDDEPTNEHRDMVLELYRKCLKLRKRKVKNPETGKLYGCKGMEQCCREIEQRYGLRHGSISKTTMGRWWVIIPTYL